MDTLTNANQVREALRLGARIEPEPGQPRLLRLVGADGTPIPAWQQALHTAQRKPA
jgi:hypothetical protein